MKRFVIIAIVIAHSFMTLQAVESPMEADTREGLEKVERELKIDGTPERIFVDIVNEKLADLILKIAKLKGINVELPEGSPFNDIKVSHLNIPNKVTVKWTWEMIISLLKKIGYSVIPKKNSIAIVLTQNINQEPVPVFINISPDFLPDSDQTVRYLYYFENINLADQNTNAKNNLMQMLNDLLPVNQAQNFLLDETYNSMLITSGARNIKDIMQIIRTFDQTGFREAAVVLPMFHTQAVDIVNTINQLIPSGQEQFRYPSLLPTKLNRYSYFSDTLRVVPIVRANAIAILGPVDSVEKLRDFVQKYLDRAADAERVTIHVKPLQFLDAATFAAALTNLIAAQAQQGGDQSTTQVTSVDSVLRGVVITAEEAKGAAEQQDQQQQASLTATGNDVGLQLDAIQNKGAIIGGNNLIVGARESDWQIIERIIDECDTLQQQIALEALVLNVNMDIFTQLGVQGRGFNVVSDPSEVKWQSAQLGQPFLNSLPSPAADGTINNAAGIDADLAQLSTVGPSGTISPGTNVIQRSPGVFIPGSTTATLADDSGVTHILNVLLKQADTIVLSSPYVITTNHKQANMYVASTQRVFGSINPQVTGGQVVTNIDTINAAIELSILPRISNNGENINLEVSVKINEFDTAETTYFTILKRTVVSNINLRNKEVTVLGGLSRLESQKSQTEVPLLGDIPLIGFLFKNRQTILNQQRIIVVFLRPTIIHPRLGGGADDFTLEKYRQTRSGTALNSSLFNSLNQPITTYLFKPEQDQEILDQIDTYMDRGAFGKPSGSELDKKLGEPVSDEINEKIKLLMQGIDTDIAVPSPDPDDLDATQAFDRIDHKAP